LRENVLTESLIVLGLPDFQIIEIRRAGGNVEISARYTGQRLCAHCGATRLRNKGWVERKVRHEDWGLRHDVLRLLVPKSKCLQCGRYSRQRLTGILPYQRSSEAFQKAVYQLHLDGINRSCLGRREGIGAATVERYFQRGLQRQFKEWHPPCCPQFLGIDEHFFTRRKGYATTFCDLRHHKVYDVVLGRSETALQAYLERLQGKDAVQMVSMDLATVYRSLVRKYFPHARIVADRFHVIRIVNHHFLACWRELDPVGSKSRGLLSLLRRHPQNLKPDQQTRLADYLSAHPPVQVIYAFKQKLCSLLLNKRRTRKQCRKLIPRLLRTIAQLRQAGLAQLVQLGETLYSWREEIAAMFRYTRNNGITEGFHNKMELISRQAYGFRNFENYRMRVKVLCS
jgi:transposase